MKEFFSPRRLEEKLAHNADNIAYTDFTPESVKVFLDEVADRTGKVAENSYPGPWRLSPLESQRGLLIAPLPCECPR